MSAPSNKTKPLLPESSEVLMNHLQLDVIILFYPLKDTCLTVTELNVAFWCQTNITAVRPVWVKTSTSVLLSQWKQLCDVFCGLMMSQWCHQTTNGKLYILTSADHYLTNIWSIIKCEKYPLNEFYFILLVTIVQNVLEPLVVLVFL